ncbi:glycosyltransferase family 9 protein [uncultured Desulfovibrio sp.]|uniref:glycosyltransferase family 9 protein n=1 Tax=uncultured Desulfovibrio sp. TaxID=167968 RepID=UPI002627DAFE|nr:glycosyltransferase family 9 protein [uncultured Desulfovibrio sp.]
MSVDILFLNLTRFGDLLQSQALFEDCRRAGLRAGLICLENFAAALPLLRSLAEAWPLPGGEFLRRLDGNGPGGSWHDAPALLLDFVDRLRREAAPRHIVNLTATLPARLLASLLAPSPEAVTGFAMDREGFGFCQGNWAAYLCGSTLKRCNAPFNMQDMFRMAARPAIHALGHPADDGEGVRGGRLLPPSDTASAQAAALLAGAPEGCRGFVGLQLGASHPARQWPQHFFAQVGDGLWQTARLCPVLLGTSAERPLARAYGQHARGPFLDAVGATSLPVLAGLVARLRLLVTNDTGTMHLAAGLGIPSLAIFLATAQAWDTGPYLEGCCCLEPALPCHPCGFQHVCPHDGRCRMHISPRTVLRLALGWLESGRWDTGVDNALRQEARVWLTARDDGSGFADLVCLSGHEYEDRSLWLRLQRRFWQALLDDLDGVPVPSGISALPPDFLEAAGASGTTHALLPVLREAGHFLAALPDQCRLAAAGHPRMGQLLLRACDHVQRLLESRDELTSLGYFWHEARQARGDKLDALARLARTFSCRLQELDALLTS